MPVPLRSITGTVPYEIEQLLRDLVVEVNQLEEALTASDAARGALAVQVATLTAQVDRLSSEVRILRSGG